MPEPQTVSEQLDSQRTTFRTITHPEEFPPRTSVTRLTVRNWSVKFLAAQEAGKDTPCAMAKRLTDGLFYRINGRRACGPKGNLFRKAPPVTFDLLSFIARGSEFVHNFEDGFGKPFRGYVPTVIELEG